MVFIWFPENQKLYWLLRGLKGTTCYVIFDTTNQWNQATIAQILVKLRPFPSDTYTTGTFENFKTVLKSAVSNVFETCVRCLGKVNWENILKAFEMQFKDITKVGLILYQFF